ncbi:MAG: translocation protein TolB [Cyclobacteriaceae bacterium]|nr:translocation protein TolB [Cyclobacteriaceae bacterium]
MLKQILVAIILYISVNEFINRMYKNIILYSLALFLSFQLKAQESDVTFGKNRVQYKEFKWRYFSAENFDIYFYDDGHLMAKQVSNYLEEEFDKITDLIGYPPYSKTKIFLYNSVKDMQQSNVGIDDNRFDVGGETKFIKPYVEVANPGTAQALKQELILKVSQFLVNEMLFGGSLKDMFQSTYLLNLPNWFVLGISEYMAKGWNEEMDDYIRELMINFNPKNLKKHNHNNSKIVGHSIWNFIAERYGRSNISNILNYTRIIRNEEKSITATLGISFNTLMIEWQEYYTGMNNQLTNHYILPNEASALTTGKRGYDLHQVKISPEGRFMAYTRGKEGKHQVVIINLENGKETIVLKSGTVVINQQIDPEIMVIDWADENTLGIINNEKGNLQFWLYDLLTKNKFSRPLYKITNVKSISFNENGRLAAISAEVNGKNDIYLLSTRRDRIKRLTNDLYDDITPSFLPNTNTIIFSSNRTSDTLDVKKKVSLTEISPNYNLFFYNLDTTRNVLHRITNTLSKDYYPTATSSNNIYYLSDQKGIVNLYRYNLTNKIYSQITNYQLSIRDYDLNLTAQSMGYVMLDDQNERLYYDQDFDFETNVFTPASGRKQILQAKQIAQKRLKRKNEEAIDNDYSSSAEQIPKSDLEKLFEADIAVGEETKDTQTDIINTDNYVFDKEVEDKEKENGSFLAQYRNFRKKSDIQGPFPYESRFSADNLVTSFMFDPLWNFGININTRMNDMLENHKFRGGAQFTLDAKSGDIYGEYYYLKQLIDFEIRFNRKTIFFDETLHKYAKNEFEVGASYPFSVKSRVTIKPFFATTRFDNSYQISPPGSPLVFADSKKGNYGGGKIEFVFDNSIVNELNSIIGTRMKASLNHYEGMSKVDQSFTKLSFDFRHYQKIHREIVFASRFFYGSYFGNAPHQYMLGGMDNWIGRNLNTNGNSPLYLSPEKNSSTLLFSEFVTNLRGYHYAELYGENVMLANFEFRFPVVRYLHSNQISSNFFRNLQFIGFYDIGSAWTGNSPFDKENSIGIKKIKEGAFEAQIKNFRNPWLSSYGTGLRTVVLGYYLKMDIAWPVIDYKIRDPRLTVTLGLDF